MNRSHLRKLLVLSALGFLASGIAIGIELAATPTHTTARSSTPSLRGPITTHLPRQTGAHYVAVPATTIPVVISGAPITVSGDGLGSAVFGQAAAVVVDELKPLLGPPIGLFNDAGDCTVDAAVTWSGVNAYFFNGSFVGYDVGELATVTGYERAPNAMSAQGLRIGDTVAQAERLYPGSFHLSYAQGGSWSVTTPTGQLAGLLVANGGVMTTQSQIDDISAGSVGCPAVSP